MPMPFAAKSPSTLAALAAITARAALVGLLVLPGAVLQSAGLSAVRSQHLFESSENPIYPPAPDEYLGNTLASGDFDGDGIADLAIGIPRDRHLFAPDPVGAVQIRYGTAGGGLPGGVFVDSIWQGGASSIDPPESLDRFGCALAVGNFNGDLYDDLAVGVCHEDLGDDEDAGAVEIRYGGPGGLTHDGLRQFLHQNTAGLDDSPEDFDRFGESLAAGDFDGNGFDDLAIGVAGESEPDHAQNGIVHALFGTASGLSTEEAQTFGGFALGYASGDFFRFAHALAAADFNGDSFDDLAIGSPGRNGVGAVFVINGYSGGLINLQAYLHQAVDGVEDNGETGDNFGWSLAAGHFGADAYADLAVGVPLEDTGPANEVVDAGCAHLFFGTEDGLTGLGSQYWVASNGGVPGGQEAGDRFGTAIARGDFDHNGFADLLIGVPGDPVLAISEVGELVVLPGTSLGPSTTGAAAWSLFAPGVPGLGGSGDQLGFSLATGDFDADGHLDLAAGAPFSDTEAGNAGSVLVLYGVLFGDGFESGAIAGWSTSSP